MFLANVDSIPDRKYEILGMVTQTTFTNGFEGAVLEDAFKKMMGEVAYMGGNGIIGIKIHCANNGSCLIVGTAIRFY